MMFKLPTAAMVVALTPVVAETAFGQAATTAQAKPAPRISAFIDVNFGVVFPAQGVRVGGPSLAFGLRVRF